MPQINTATQFDQQNSHGVILEDGSRAVFWLSENDPPDGAYSIKGQLFDGGTKIGGEFTVPGTENTPIPGGSTGFEDWDDEDTRTFRHHDSFYDQDAAEFDVAVLADGTIAIAYVDGDGLAADVNDSAIAAVGIDIDTGTGAVTQTQAPMLVSETVTAGVNAQFGPSIEALPEGGFAVFWTQTPTGTSNTFSAAEDYGLKVFDEDFAPDTDFNGGDGLQINFGSNEYGGDMTVLTDGAGSTIGYFVAGFDDGPNRNFYRVIDTDGNTVTTTSIFGARYVDEVDQLSNGEILVAEPAWFNTGGSSNVGRFTIWSYNETAGAIQLQHTINIGVNGAHSIDLEPVDGGYWAAWTQPGDPDTIGYAFYDNNGVISADGIQTLGPAETGFDGQIGQPSITVDENGEITITYSFDDDGSQSGIAQGVVCFCRGTLIETDAGPVPVEKLCAGHRVHTLDHGLQTVRWIGSHRHRSNELVEYPNLLPIRITAGALGNGLPVRDLRVSRQHRVLVQSKIAERMFGSDEVLVAAIKLVTLPGIDICDDVDNVEYFHVLCDRHEILVVEGAPLESLLTGPEALKALTAAAISEIETLFPGTLGGSSTPEPARHIPSGSKTKQLIRRHHKNHKAICRQPQPLIIRAPQTRLGRCNLDLGRSSPGAQHDVNGSWPLTTPHSHYQSI